MVRVAGPRAIRDPRPESGLTQLHFTGLLERLSRRDAEGPANILFGLVLALLGFGLLLQAGHAATVMGPAEFKADFLSEVRDRILALGVLLLAVRTGIRRLERFLPLGMSLAVLALVLVWAPVIGSGANGSNRWLRIGLSVQPSEFARVALILWVAWYSIRLGPKVNELGGVLRMFLPTLLFAGLVWVEPDKGGACVLFLCAAATMWVGGVDSSRVALPFFLLVAGAMVIANAANTYSRGRIEMWIGDSYNEQVVEGMGAIASSGSVGAGFAGGELRNRGFSYMDSDFVFSLVAEEFGAFGMALVLAAFCACLLYTSPSPRDATLSRMPSSA